MPLREGLPAVSFSGALPSCSIHWNTVFKDAAILFTFLDVTLRSGARLPFKDALLLGYVTLCSGARIPFKDALLLRCYSLLRG